MQATFLGTGTSSGIPMIACDCRVCLSKDPRNRRRRTSLYVKTAEVCLLIDCAPDFREQALAYGLRRVDAVLFTHAHADHIFGFDDIRRFNTLQGSVIRAYGSPETLKQLRQSFPYIDAGRTPGLYRPQVEFVPMEEPVDFPGLRVTPIEVEHGHARTYGFRFDYAGCSLVYAPDCKRMDARAIAQCKGVDVMVLDCLRRTPEHITHPTVAQSLEMLGEIGARESWLIHLCHDLDHQELEDVLPSDIHVAYDGLTLTLPVGTSCRKEDG